MKLEKTRKLLKTLIEKDDAFQMGKIITDSDKREVEKELQFFEKTIRNYTILFIVWIFIVVLLTL